MEGVIKSVATTSEFLDSGATRQLTFSARNQSNEVVAVSPGSARWEVLDGGQYISLTADGFLTGTAVGVAHIRVTVDGVSSGAATINVLAPSSPIYSWTSGKGGYMGDPGFSAVEGNQFKIVGGKDVVVTMLGYEADRPVNTGGTTAIFSANGTMLASATITNADILEDGYYYKVITPLTLSAGSTYYIGSLHGTGATGSCRSETNTAVFPPYIQDLGTRWKFSSTIEGGSWNVSGPRHYVGNFQAYEVAP